MMPAMVVPVLVKPGCFAPLASKNSFRLHRSKAKPPWPAMLTGGRACPGCWQGWQAGQAPLCEAITRNGASGCWTALASGDQLRATCGQRDQAGRAACKAPGRHAGRQAQQLGACSPASAIQASRSPVSTHRSLPAAASPLPSHLPPLERALRPQHPLQPLDSDPHSL